MMDKLKEYGLVHAGIAMILAWTACFAINPLAGMITSGFCAGWYGSREEKEAELRKFRPLTPSTWKFGQFEWKDFLVTWAAMAFNVWIMNGM